MNTTTPSFRQEDWASVQEESSRVSSLREGLTLWGLDGVGDAPLVVGFSHARTRAFYDSCIFTFTIHFCFCQKAELGQLPCKSRHPLLISPDVVKAPKRLRNLRSFGVSALLLQCMYNQTEVV